MMNAKKIIITFSLCLFPLLSYGASSTFTISTLVGSDTTPPSSPSLISVIPVSTSQIDVTWTASTDNFLLQGYQVFRNSVQIATTTLTTYSDSSLTAATPYIYSVRAFDSAFNHSTSSNTLATSTFSSTVTPSPSGRSGTQSSGGELSLTEFKVVPYERSASFFWETATFAKFDLRWGRTISYELGFVSHDILRREQRTLVPDLESGTVYEFELTGYDRWGKQFILRRGQFTTLSLPDTTAPPNVSNLRAYVVGDSAHLSWTNPNDEDFSKVRIIRNPHFFPINAQDGFLSYNQKGISFVDRGALRDAKIQYYTVFTIDTQGNMSSGAVIAVVQNGGTIPQVEKVDTQTTKASEVHTLLFEDFRFSQDAAPLAERGLSTDDSFLVQIEYDKLPPHLKTITMTIGTAPEDVTFLLRINKEKTHYEAYISKQMYRDSAPVVFSVYDFKTKTMQRVSGIVLFYSPLLTDESATLFTPLITTLAVKSEVITFAFFFSIFTVLLLFMMIGRRLRE